MERLFSILKRLAPESLDIMQVRYNVLRQIKHKNPIGRRQLGKDLGYSERTIRAEIEILKTQGAVSSTSAGIYLTAYGEMLLREIDEYVPFLFNIQMLAETLKQLFKLQEVIIVPGDSAKNNLIKKDIGRIAAWYLQKKWYPGCKLAVTGGTTLAAMADSIGQITGPMDIMVIPARGGLGEEMEQQAGAIAAKIASSVKGNYKLLHIPDNLEATTVQVLKQDVHVKEVVNIIKSCDILVHGIGAATEMAIRRGLTAKEINYLQENAACGEALRYYFDKQGNIVYEVPGIGLELNDVTRINTVIAVAGGSTKAEAIKSVLKNGYQHVLITDEGAANTIVNGKGGIYGS